MAKCQIADEYRLRRKLSQLGKGKQQAGKKELDILHGQIMRSQKACERREKAVPVKIEFPEQLPVSGKAQEIAELLKANQVLVVAGDTGSGKTTQLPKICLQAGFGRRGLIAHTQPRRLAAVSVANRIAEELGTESGDGVAYQVRFNERQTENSYLKVMTDGILLAEIQQDRFLNKYEVIIVDEAHERSLNIDFLLGFLKQLLTRRKDLKLIITSATIDVEKFSEHFSNAPIVKVSGRTYPVEVRYEPINAAKDEVTSDLQTNAVVAGVERILSEKKSAAAGDILVFLSGEREIRDTAQALRKQRLANVEILPLYARLRHTEQVKIFRPHQGRRVVLSTNVAETSLTVPGINYVIDTGLARISRYSLQSKVQRLPIEPVSQASANQRKGRCGRLADGVCVRLYSKEDFESRPEFTDPEIKRTNLGSVILKMKHLRLGEPESFPFIEPPEGKAINEGIKLLVELDALTPDGKLTAAGRQMASMPVDPRLARMLVTASKEQCLQELLVIVSAMSIQDPREIGADNRQRAQEKLAQFDHPESDFLTLYNIWSDYEQRRQDLTQGQLRKYCKTHFLSFMRMREWREVHRQLLLSCQQMNLKINKSEGSFEQVHRSIISGSLNQVAMRQEGRVYQGSRNRKFTLFPGSVLSKQSAKWIVTGELIETSQVFASMAGRIQPEWIEQMALHLVKREHYQPHWSSKRQEVMAYEKVQLYGLTILDKKQVSFAHLDPRASYEIFLRSALLEGEVETRSPFYRANRKLLEELAKDEEKIRRPDFIVGDREILQFYEQRIPEHISSTRELENWLKKEGPKAIAELTMRREKLLAREDALAALDAFPDQAPIQHNKLKIDYSFEPGTSRDGATMEVPLAVLNQITSTDVDWAVPGIMREKSIALLKGLPKSMRKNFIPVSGFVDQILPQMVAQDGDLIDALIIRIRQEKKIDLQREDFAGIELPNHLITKIKVVDESGEELGFGDSLEELQETHGAEMPRQSSSRQAQFGHELEQSGMTDFLLDEFPEQIAIGEELVLLRYPALVDKDSSVDLCLLADAELAATETSRGLVRLYKLRSVQQRNALRKQFVRFVNRHALILPAQLIDLTDQAVDCVYRSAFNIAVTVPRSKEEFEKCLHEGKRVLLRLGDDLEKLLESILQEQWKIRSRLTNLEQGELAYLSADISAQLDRLLAEDCLQRTDYEWLCEFPRYLQAVNIRLEKLPYVGPRDKPQTEELQQLWKRYEQKAKILGLKKQSQLQVLRWQLEEYRVSQFAQQLGTKIPVSAKRIEKQFAQLDKA